MPKPRTEATRRDSSTSVQERRWRPSPPIGSADTFRAAGWPGAIGELPVKAPQPSRSKFCAYHGVKLNMDKSTYTFVPRRGQSKEQPTPIEINGVSSKVGHLDGYFKYLGIYMSPLGVLKHEVGKLQGEVEEIYDII